MSAFTTIKVEFGSQLRRLAFDSAGSSWATVRSLILSSYGLDAADSAQCALHYLDEENDLISVNSDSEFAEAIRCAKQKNKILKLILSKSEKAAKAVPIAANSDEKHSQAEELEQKAPLLKLAVDARSDSDIRVEDAADGDADQQVEEMDLPLDRRDLLSRSPTLSEASDSSFVSINAQSLREELDEKDEQAVEGGNDSSVLKAASMEEDGKVAAASSAAATPSQPEFVASDRAVVQDVMKQLAQDIIQLKAETPTAASTAAAAKIAAVSEKITVDSKAENAANSRQESKVDVEAASSASVPNMKVKELRSIVEGVINEKFLSWLDDLLAAVDNLDHADEDVKRVHQLTARIRLGLADVSANRQYVQRISDGMAKKMMRVMKQAEGKLKTNKDKPQPTEDEQETKKASPPSLPPPTVTTPSSSACCATSAAASSTVSLSTSTSSCAVAVHDGITCDGCNMSPIRGVRFHCISCDQIEKVRCAGGYDLCEGCESKGIHQQVDGKRHVMIKIKIPTRVIVDIEAPRGPVVGPAVYDVLRVNADGSRTPFRTPQPVVALPVLTPASAVPQLAAKSSPSSSSSSSSSKAEVEESAGSAKVEELERRIRALESLITVDAKSKAEKRMEKERMKMEKAERKRQIQEAVAVAKAAKLEAKAKQKEAKALAKAAEAAKKRTEEQAVDKKHEKDEKAEAVPKVEEKVAVQESAAQQDVQKDAAQPASPATAERSSNTAVLSPPLVAPAAVPATPAVSSAPSASAPSASPAPFSFATFPFSNMVNSITSTVSNTLSAAPFAFGANQSNNIKPAAMQPPASAPLFSAVAPSSFSTSAVSSSSSASIWSSPTVSGKRTLADVRAPAFFPYISQLRELETMGFDVDKSIYALRYYRGDMQKSINSML